MLYLILLLCCLFPALGQSAESLSSVASKATAAASQKTNELINWQACEKATREEHAALGGSPQCTARTDPYESVDEISEALFFDGAAREQIKAHECTVEQTDDLLDPKDLADQESREAIAHVFTNAVSDLRKLKATLGTVERRLDEIEHTMSSPMGDVSKNHSDEIKEQRELSKQRDVLLNAIDAVSKSVWRSGNHFVQERLQEGVESKNFDPERFKNEFLKKSGKGSLNELLQKMRDGAKKEKATLLNLASKKDPPPSGFVLSDGDKMRIFRDRNWMGMKVPEPVACRMEGRYGKGRERFYFGAEVIGGTALAFLPGGLYLAVLRGAMTVRTATILAAVATSASIAQTYEKTCKPQASKTSVQATCVLPSESFVKELESESCALNVAMAAMDLPFPELKSLSMLGLGLGLVGQASKADGVAGAIAKGTGAAAKALGTRAEVMGALPRGKTVTVEFLDRQGQVQTATGSITDVYPSVDPYLWMKGYPSGIPVGKISKIDGSEVTAAKAAIGSGLQGALTDKQAIELVQKETKSYKSKPINKLSAAAGMPDKDLALIQLKAKSVLTVEEFLAKTDLQEGFALGLTNDGGVYSALTKIKGLDSWQQAYAKHGVGQTEIGHTEKFMKKATTANKPIVFFVPNDLYTFKKNGVTLSEMKWLLSHPERMKNVHFVFGSYDVFSEKTLKQLRAVPDREKIMLDALKEMTPPAP